MAELFGQMEDGRTVDQISITNRHGMRAVVLTYGAALQSLWVPDKTGKLGDVVLGFDSLSGYLADTTYLGVVVGRVAGRIAGAKFLHQSSGSHTGCPTTGEACHVTLNHGECCLHGGRLGMSRRVWKLDRGSLRSDSVTLTMTSEDGDEGFPGTAQFSITYRISPDNELELIYSASLEGASCPLNLTNHSYFNLSGVAGSSGSEESVFGHEISIAGVKTLLLRDSDLTPTGEVVPLAGSPLDLRVAKQLSASFLGSIGDSEPHGFDSYYIFPSEEKGADGILAEPSRVQARVFHPESGRVMELITDQPGVQFYTANFLDGNGPLGKAEQTYKRHAALCLEAQSWPDAVNHPDFPDIFVHPGGLYSQTTKYRFSIA